jgi:hypothetical protein
VRVLLDNCVPWRFAESIHDHEVAGVIDLGWAELTNGRLLDAMARQFDVLVTVDKGIRFSNGSTTVLSPLSSSAPDPIGYLTFCRWFQPCFRSWAR